MRTVILNTSIGGWYPKGAARLQASLRDVGYTGNIQCWINELPPNCRPHSVIPYHFKPMAFHWAVEHRYDMALWIDSACWFIRHPNVLFDIIEDKGQLIFYNGWNSGQWCADSALEPLGITREESFTYNHAMACVMGFDLRKDSSIECIQHYSDVAKDAFPGAWTNSGGEASADPRVLGHRHDQTAISVISTKLGMQWTDCAGVLEYGTKPEYSTTVILSQGL